MTTGIDAQTCKLIILDSNIGSMTEFKQIIGRGTRINEEYGKTYFNILDFRNVTDLFADPDFDGEPEVIKDISGDIDSFEIEDDEPVIGDDGEEIIFTPIPPGGGAIEDEPSRKVRVDGVEVSIINERVQYLGVDGKVITETLKDYTKKGVTKKYKSLDSFLNSWNDSEKKQAIINELEEEGVFFSALNEEVGKEFDPFDLVCHVAFDAKPLTRKERANNVKKRNYFTKYGEKAQNVLNALLDKYSEEGIETIESTEFLKLDPFNKIGTPIEIVKSFGTKKDYLQAVKELELELYKNTG